MLREATGDARVIVLWAQQAAGGEVDDGALRGLVAAASVSADEYYVAVADVPAPGAAAPENEANARLAAGLGVSHFPQCHVYAGMKLEEKVVGLAAMERFCLRVAGCEEEA